VEDGADAGFQDPDHFRLDQSVERISEARLLEVGPMNQERIARPDGHRKAGCDRLNQH
jgi:hypothetical protein